MIFSLSLCFFHTLFFFDCIFTCMLLSTAVSPSRLCASSTRYVYAALHLSFKWPLPSLTAACLKVVSNILYALLGLRVSKYVHTLSRKGKLSTVFAKYNISDHSSTRQNCNSTVRAQVLYMISFGRISSILVESHFDFDSFVEAYRVMRVPMCANPCTYASMYLLCLWTTHPRLISRTTHRSSL